MNKNDKFRIELKDINIFYQKQKTETENRIRTLLISAIDEIGDYFISKGFIYFEEHITHIPVSNKRYIEIVRYYYDKNTKVGIKINVPHEIDLDRENTFIPLRIFYKLKNSFESYESEIFYRYTIEDAENVFKRFKSYNGKAGVRKVKNFMRENFKREMLIDDRNEKIKNLNSL